MHVDQLKRREFITLLGGAVALPVAARAQQPATTHRIGFLGAASPSGYASQLEALRSGLRGFGHLEGKNLVIEFRWAEGRYDRLPELAAELVRLKIEVLVTHGTPGTRAAKRETSTIPIVMATSGDALATGLVDNIARPSGNTTGLSFFSPELAAKRLELIKETVPGLTRLAFLLNPDNPVYCRKFTRH